MSDAAFVVVFIGRDDFSPRGEMISSGRPVLNHFEVERSVKGDVGERVQVVAAAESNSCGLALEVGQRVGLFLYHGPEGWSSSLCSRADPDTLLTLAAEEPAFVAEEPNRETQSADGRDTSRFIVIGLAVLVISTFMAIRRAFRR